MKKLFGFGLLIMLLGAFVSVGEASQVEEASGIAIFDNQDAKYGNNDGVVNASAKPKALANIGCKITSVVVEDGRAVINGYYYNTGKAAGRVTRLSLKGSIKTSNMIYNNLIVVWANQDYYVPVGSNINFTYYYSNNVFRYADKASGNFSTHVIFNTDN